MDNLNDDIELSYDDLPEDEKEAIWDMLFPNMSEEEIEEYCEGLFVNSRD